MEQVITAAPSTDTMFIVVVIVAVCICIAVLAVGGYVISEDFTCNRGDYKCDDHKVCAAPASGSEPEGETHVAAWDLPSLDYLSEEQTMKYLKNARGQISREDSEEDSGSSPSPSGSLPECEQSSSSGRPRYDLVNRAYVHDEMIRKTSIEAKDV